MSLAQGVDRADEIETLLFKAESSVLLESSQGLSLDEAQFFAQRR
jgi:hypothetical protein